MHDPNLTMKFHSFILTMQPDFFRETYSSKTSKNQVSYFVYGFKKKNYSYSVRVVETIYGVKLSIDYNTHFDKNQNASVYLHLPKSKREYEYIKKLLKAFDEGVSHLHVRHYHVPIPEFSFGSRHKKEYNHFHCVKKFRRKKK